MRTRLMAVMLTDLTGYTAFSSHASRADITAAIRQQKRVIAPIIRRFRGRIVKWIGDAALCVFDSATDAIICGREVQTSLLRRSDRLTGAIRPAIKVAVHAGDLNIDTDGDIYGDAVNVCARMEKAAQDDEVYFSEAVRLLVSPAEIPYERAGAFSFKGVAAAVTVYKTCFGATPVLRERVAIAHTNFTHLQMAADKYGWERIHPIAERITEAVIEAARANGGTNRGVSLTGCTLTFTTIGDALAAAKTWEKGRRAAFARTRIHPKLLRLRTGVHWGSVHVLKYTLMGRDLDVVRTLAPLGVGDEVLITGDALRVAEREGVATGFREVGLDALRDCRSREAWRARFMKRGIFLRPLARRRSGR